MISQTNRANLHRRNFQGKNLGGADFSNTDIRGLKFINATLIGANFHNAKAGLPTYWTIGLIILSLFLSLLAGLISGYSGALIGDLLNNFFYTSSLLGNISLITLGIFLIIIFWRGFGVTLVTLAEITAACLIAAIAFFPNDQIGLNLAISTKFFVVALAGIIASIINMAIAMALVKVMAITVTIISTVFIGFIGILLGVLLGVRSNALAYLPAGVIALLAIIFGIYVGIQAINENKKYQLIRLLTIGIVAYGGTSFRGANLTDADFTQATLTSVDFTEANLTRTCWFDAKNLEQACLEGTYLEQGDVRNLVITKDGRGQKFNNLNLRYLNLKDANLQDGEFIGTDLSEANLENANLLGAKLAQTQLYQANLTAACLTGAYIENWGISTETQLHGIQCDYVYMRLPTNDDPDPWRKPDNRQETFKPGDFADFVAPIIQTLHLYKSQNLDLRELGKKFKTLDLFHHEGIDPTAAALAITQLAESYPTADLELVALEGRGQEKIRLQAIVSNDASPSELYKEYFQRYTQIQSLSYSDLQAMLVGISAKDAQKDEQINSLKQLLSEAMQQPNFYAQTYQSSGDFIMSKKEENISKGSVNISGTQGDISGLSAIGENRDMIGVAIGAISGNVTNTINQLPDSDEPDKPGIKEVLTDLQAAIEADTNLSEEDKAEALEQVQKIAEAGQKPEEGAMQKMAKNSLTFLKGLIVDLPSTVELVKTCANLIPVIKLFFGLS